MIRPATAAASLAMMNVMIASDLPVPERGYLSLRPARTWEEGLLTGNGTLGMNAFGRPLDERIILTHERLFMPMGPPHVPPDQSASLPEIRRLIREGRYKDAERLQAELSGQKGFMYPEFFVPAFDLVLTGAAEGEVRGYSRTVDFRKAEAAVSWSDDRGVFERRMFVSRKDGVAVVRVLPPRPGRLDLRLKLEAREPSEEFNDDSDIASRSDEMFARHFGGLRSSSGEDWLAFGARFLRAYPGSLRTLEGRARVVLDGGRSEAMADGSLAVRGADGVLILLDLHLSADGTESGQEILAERLGKLPADYQGLLAAHAAVHGAVFDRVKLDLGGGADHRKPTEELMAESTFDRMNPAWLEKQFDAGRYNILCSTGALPPNLQGVWGGTYVPGWASDYTHNGNLPSAIAANHMGNMPELMLPYFDYLESLVPQLEVNARNYYGCRGILLPSRTSTHGYNNALSADFAGGMWTAGAPWAAHFFHDHYLYTGDEEFLAGRALPFMEKVALFFEDFATEGPDGRLVFSPAQSPENWPAGSNSQASYNATMDIAAVKELLRNLVSASRHLGRNADRIPVWEGMLEKLPDYAVAENGIIKEWLTPELGNNDAHRHASQLYPLYDGLPGEIDASPVLRAAFRRSVEDKLERYWKDNERGFMSFGIVQLGQVAASLGHGETAHHCLSHLVDGFWLNNLASTHNRRALFNMDISGGQPAVVMKMLADSSPGTIRLLPALPRAWSEGGIEGLRCRGAIVLDHLRWNGREIEVGMTSATDQQVSLVLPRGIAGIEGAEARTVPGRGANVRQIRLPAGRMLGMRITLADP